MMAQREEAAVRDIISRLQDLGYDGLDTYEPEWVQAVLLCGDGGRGAVARNKLLMWLLLHLSPSTTHDLQAAPQHLHKHKILDCLSSMGVCQSGDMDIIEGTAPALRQLKFWQGCLESMANLRRMSGGDGRGEPDALMYCLTHSPHLQHTLQSGDVSFVPGDMVKKYRAWSKQSHHNSLTDSLHSTQKELDEQKQEYQEISEEWKTDASHEEHKTLESEVVEALTNLDQKQSLLRGVYTSYIAPWTQPKDQLELPRVGPLVQQSREQLGSVMQALQVTEEAVRRCEEMEEEEEEGGSNTNALTNSITTTLHTLATQHTA